MFRFAAAVVPLALAACAHHQVADPVVPAPAEAAEPAPVPAPDRQRGLELAEEGHTLLATDPVASLARFEEAWVHFKHKLVAYYASSAAALTGEGRARLSRGKVDPLSHFSPRRALFSREKWIR